MHHGYFNQYNESSNVDYVSCVLNGMRAMAGVCDGPEVMTMKPSEWV